MRILGIDCETTGIHFENDRILELALVVWDTEAASVLHLESHFLLGEDYPPCNPIAEAKHKITPLTLQEFGVLPEKVLPRIQSIVARCKIDYYCGHNARSFDRAFILAECQRQGHLEWMPNIPWLDTMKDLPQDPRQGSMALSYLAADHGLLNPFGHRAMFDVLTMFRVLSLYDINRVVKNSKAKIHIVKALVSMGTKDQAKAEKFRWQELNGKSYPLCWVKELREDQLEEERKRYPFNIAILETYESNPSHSE